MVAQISACTVVPYFMTAPTRLAPSQTLRNFYRDRTAVTEDANNAWLTEMPAWKNCMREAIESVASQDAALCSMEPLSVGSIK